MLTLCYCAITIAQSAGYEDVPSSSTDRKPRTSKSHVRKRYKYIGSFSPSHKSFTQSITHQSNQPTQPTPTKPNQPQPQTTTNVGLGSQHTKHQSDTKRLKKHQPQSPLVCFGSSIPRRLFSTSSNPSILPHHLTIN